MISRHRVFLTSPYIPQGDGFFGVGASSVLQGSALENASRVQGLGVPRSSILLELGKQVGTSDAILNFVAIRMAITMGSARRDGTV